MQKIIAVSLGLGLILAWAAPQPWARQGGISLLRDAETEHTIRVFATPVFEAAGLDPAAVQVHLVNDRSLNAFVAGGQRIFFNTGLLLRSQSPNQLIGVIAHETGHISGGHLARTQDALRGASAQSILAFILGAAAAVGGSPEAGAAIITGGQHVAQRSLLQYTRTQESAADQAAAAFLDRSGQSPRGLLEFMDILGDQEVLAAGRQDPYVRTHPLSVERIVALRERLGQSRYANTVDPPEHIEMFKRMQAKLLGYLEGLPATLRKYPPEDTSLPARYARAFAYYRVPDIHKAMAELDSLLAARPEDPFFHELRGQILFEHGRVNEAVEPNRRAVRYAPNEPLLRFSLAQVLVATEDPALNKEAIGHLEEMLRRDPYFTSGWQQLAIAQGREGNLGMAAVAGAERFLLEGKRLDARGQAERAIRLLPQGSPGWLRAQDISAEATRELKEQRERR